MRRLVALLCVAVCAARAQAQTPAPVPFGDTPLSNDAAPPMSSPAREQFARGDQALADLRAKDPRDAERAWTEVCEAWRAALAQSSVGECVAPEAREGTVEPLWPDPDATASRRVEGVEYALLRRLSSLAPADRARWTARFDALARERLAAAGEDLAALASLERELAATWGACVAALRLCDASLEEGRVSAARGWLARAQRHAELGALADPTLAAALARRSAAANTLAPPVAPAREAWRDAQRLETAGQSRFGRAWSPDRAVSDDAMRREFMRRLREGGPTGVRTGGAFLPSGLLFVHTRDRAAVIDPAKPADPALFEPRKVLADRSIEVGETFARRGEPGWSLEPVVAGTDVILVVGRTQGDSPNALARFTPPDLAAGSGNVPHMVWALWNCVWLSGEDSAEELPDDLCVRQGEFQPGPVILGSELFVLARETRDATSSTTWSEHAARTWLCAIDLASGRPLWKRDLGQGVEGPREERAAFLVQRPGSMPAQALALVDGRIFAGTHTGLGVLLDAADGRPVWAIKNRRRDARDAGWDGGRPRADASARTIGWAPADGDFLYSLRAEPLLDGRGVMLAEPARSASAIALLDASSAGASGSAVVLERAGEREVVSTWDLASGARVDSIEFQGASEPAALVSPARVLVAGERGLVLLDRTRELAVLDVEDCEPELRRVPGEVLCAREDLVAWISENAVQFFRAR